MTYRIGVVDYLNARPLTWAIERGRIEGLAAVPAVPAVLGAKLLAGELDAAIVSSVMAIREPRLAQIPEAGCISADGPVQSVLLFTKVHWDQIGTVALDTSSLTSVALVRLLLERRFGLRPQYRHLAPDLAGMLDVADAALLIGDPGLSQYFRDRRQPAPYDVLDLGRAWRDWTGLPFVFAAWVAPRDRLADGRLAKLLVLARERSATMIEEMAAAEAARLELPTAVCRHYLEQVIRYDFGPREQAGLARFAELVREMEQA